MFLYKTTPVACCCKAQVNGSCFVMELWDKAERLWTRVKNWKTVRGWHIWKLKLVDARLYFVSMFVGLLTGLVAVPYHYLLYYLFHLRSGFFASHPPGTGTFHSFCFLGAFSSSSCGSWGKCRLSVGEVFRRHAA